MGDVDNFSYQENFL